MKMRARRSLEASPEGIKRANKAVLSFATKIDLAAELEISRATVQNFFAGKPIGRGNFHNICQKLQLPWQEIADLPVQPQVEPQEESGENTSDIDALVQQVRQKIRPHVVECGGSMRVLDMSQPRELADIYTNVNILEKITGRRRLEVAELLAVCAKDESDRPGLGRIACERAGGLEVLQKYSKLMVLGKPGAGKTTFLKHIALQCSRGELLGHLVPIFIKLKDFAETSQYPSLVEYIQQLWWTKGVNEPQLLQLFLRHGRALVLLDGLDEVKPSDVMRVVSNVRSLVGQFHTNHFAITCRIATEEYTFEQFTEVEVADFDAQQIQSFALKWFAANDLLSSTKFLYKLSQHPQIQELATNPLLLTLLSVIFDEAADFPANRAQLYKEGLNVLLRKWDAKRHIEREQVYKQLSVQHKENLLSQIAFTMFVRGEYFVRQTELEHLIADYIRNLPGDNTQLEALPLDCEAILKSIEAQHGLLVERARGIYSFSHLTFQEYLAAREIVVSSHPQALETGLQQLVCHITNPRWREVCLLSVGMLRQADYLLQLIKRHIDQLLAIDPQLQAFLAWVSDKAGAVSTTSKPATVRAFYFDLVLARSLKQIGGTLDLARALDPTCTCALDRDLALDLALDRTLALNCILDIAPEPTHVLHSVLDRTLAHAHVVAPEFGRALEQLKEQLSHSAESLSGEKDEMWFPPIRTFQEGGFLRSERSSRADGDGKGFEAWWEANGQAWTDQLKALVISYRNFGYDWQFSHQQKEALKQYYYGNQLLVDCLNSSCYVSSIVRQQIEDTLLLPTTEFKQDCAAEPITKLEVSRI